MMFVSVGLVLFLIIGRCLFWNVMKCLSVVVSGMFGVSSGNGVCV